jgi:Trk K+ transport system NAD-binding subunit
MTLPIFKDINTEDLVHFLEGYSLVRQKVKENSKAVGQTIAELKLRQEGIVVLGIQRKKEWMHVPRRDMKIQADDSVLLYGPLKKLKSFSL